MGRWKKKSREEREEADRRLKGQPKNRRWKIPAWFRRHRAPQSAAAPPAGSSGGFSQLVLEGRFLEACRSISSSAEERQDRGCQYQVVAQGMWQVVQEALEGSGGGRELQRKLSRACLPHGCFQSSRKTPRPAAARKLLDPLMFVTWMSQVQSRLVELIQKELEKQLENVLTCDQKEWASSSCQAFLKIFQLLKGTIDSVQDVGPPVTSRVQAMVLNTFAEFLQRKTWQDLGQAHTPLADLVLCTINAIEDQSQDALVSGVRSLCQSLVQSLYRAVFTEYLQALVTHLKKLKPRKWEDQRGQVEMDVQELRETFGRQEGLGDGAPGLEAFMEVFQLSRERSSPCLDEWLASFRDRFPDYMRRESKAREGQGLAQGPLQAGAGPSLVSPPPDAEIHPAGPSKRPSPDPFLVSRAPGSGS